jgi:hypothetical protein
MLRYTEMTMNFLDTLPAPLSARSRMFFRTWHGWRRGDEIPDRNYLEFGLGEFKATSLLLDIQGHDDVPIVFAGSVFSERLGIDLTGINYLDMTSRDNRSWRAHLTMAQVAQPCGSVIYYWLRLGDSSLLPVEIVSVPLRERGAERPSLLLCCATGLARSGEESAIDPDSYEEGDGMRFIDLGFGIPPLVPSQRQDKKLVQ